MTKSVQGGQTTSDGYYMSENEVEIECVVCHERFGELQIDDEGKCPRCSDDWEIGVTMTNSDWNFLIASVVFAAFAVWFGKRTGII